MVNDGYVLLNRLHQLKQLPDIAIIDVNMPVMDGIQITKILKDHFPQIFVLGISLTNNPVLVADMLDAEAKGFISKINMDVYLSKALRAIALGEVFVEPDYEPILEHYLKTKQLSFDESNEFGLSKKQTLYLQLNASEVDYKAIAHTMHVSEHSLHNYHDSIKEKTGASSRLGQALFAIKTGIVKTIRGGIPFMYK